MKKKKDEGSKSTVSLKILKIKSLRVRGNTGPYSFDERRLFMGVLKFHQVTPTGGDCCAGYEVETDRQHRNYTVRELIDITFNTLNILKSM